MKHQIFVIAVMLFLTTITFLGIDAHAQANLNFIYTLSGQYGQFPKGGLLIDGHGNLYGTTQYGGAPSTICPFLLSCGTIFELSPDGSGGWNFQNLYSFSGGADGAAPISDLTMDGFGDIFGTTPYGGIYNSSCFYGCGTVFELSPSSAGWELKTLYSFSGPDGQYPSGGVLRDNAGRLYGTVGNGGAWGGGSVYVLEPAHGSWMFSTVFSFGEGFNAATGLAPCGGVIMDASGSLFGVAGSGGYSSSNCAALGGCGTVYELSRTGGAVKFRVLHQFKGNAFGDGANPISKLLLDSAGNLYGNTTAGGLACGTNCLGYGTIFELSNSSGSWKQQILHRFDLQHGMNPQGDLAIDDSGKLYGATTNGGTVSSLYGTIFRLAPNGMIWAFEVIYDFSPYIGGFEPMGGVTIDASGNLFGTTQQSVSYFDYGTIFEIPR